MCLRVYEISLVFHQMYNLKYHRISYKLLTTRNRQSTQKFKGTTRTKSRTTESEVADDTFLSPTGTSGIRLNGL